MLCAKNHVKVNTLGGPGAEAAFSVLSAKNVNKIKYAMFITYAIGGVGTMVVARRIVIKWRLTQASVFTPCEFIFDNKEAVAVSLQ